MEVRFTFDSIEEKSMTTARKVVELTEGLKILLEFSGVLGTNRLLVLAALLDGPKTSAEIAQVVHLELSTISDQLRLGRERGLIETTVGLHGSRFRQSHLTPKGVRVARKSLRSINEEIDSRLSSVDISRDEFERSLKVLLAVCR